MAHDRRERHWPSLKASSPHRTSRWFPTYASYRAEAGGYLPWPEWVYPPMNLSGTNGVFVFDRMLSTWSRPIGVAPYFARPVRLRGLKNSRIALAIEGGEEAEKVRSFVERMACQRRRLRVGLQLPPWRRSSSSGGERGLTART